MRASKQMVQTGIIDQLSKFGVRPLSNRIAVYRYLSSVDTHPTADAVYAELKPSLPSLSRTTVYNVLNYLCEMGAIRRVTIDGYESRFDADVTHHIHFKCKECGQVVDLMDAVFPEIAVTEGFTVDAVQVNIEGTCPSCRIHTV